MGKAYRFRVLIDHEQDAFRDIDILEDQTFMDLHQCIQDAFEFDGSQMASFYLSNDNWDKGEEIALMDFQEDFGPEKLKTMTESKIADLVNEEGQKLVYVFDFMLMWCFFVEVVKVMDQENGVDYPNIHNAYGEAPHQYSKDSPLLSDEEVSDLMEAPSVEDEISDMFEDLSDEDYSQES